MKIAILRAREDDENWKDRRTMMRMKTTARLFLCSAGPAPLRPLTPLTPYRGAVLRAAGHRQYYRPAWCDLHGRDAGAAAGLALLRHRTGRLMMACANDDAHVYSNVPRRSSSSEATPLSPDSTHQSISRKLALRFPNASVLRVEDVSGGCGSFFVVEVTDGSFVGLSTLKQHQLINRTLAEDIDKIHGLQIRTAVPAQGKEEA
ncbi:hypothetical protein PCANC_07824 [Puccinia coronata f. sp. avenae]|uniref:BolA-like protein 3 n=2 Tax=Puccinia coronata f. sp. avenae TaxID=200324 RepID=A0A2N5VBZ2_9BASI|nr:hypothetical protein PCANC_07824 [Puccinia coronata f. sp. avenae]